MPYRPHGGYHQVKIVHCPTILGNKLAHLSQDGPHSWALRDFVSGLMIRNTPPPNAATSGLSLADIEATVAYDEAPPRHNKDNQTDWATYLKMRTLAVLGSWPTATPPNPRFGAWTPF